MESAFSGVAGDSMITASVDRTDCSTRGRPPVALKPRSPHHEYELKDQLDGSWALRPLDLLHDAGRSALVLEDAAGEPLERLLGAPMEVGRFLRLAIAIASTADAGADRYSKVNLLRLARSLCGRRIRGPGGSKATAGTDLEPYSRRCPPADH
jgi:hypothetical protein